MKSASKKINENGFVNYTVDDTAEEVLIDLLEVKEKRKGTGRKLVDMVNDVACDL